MTIDSSHAADAHDKQHKPASPGEHSLSNALSEEAQSLARQSATRSKGSSKESSPESIDFARDHPFSAKEIGETGNSVNAIQNGVFRAEEGMQPTSNGVVLGPQEGQNTQHPGVTGSEGGAAGVDQGKFSDCWFESSLASLSTTTKGDQTLSKMIFQSPAQKKDGSYTVTFPGDKNHPVTVTEKDLAKYGDDLNNASGWADIVEAGAEKLYPKQFQHGADPTLGIHLLTGDSTAEKSSLGNLPEDRSTIQNALNSDNPVVVSSKPHQPHGSPFVERHAYQVVGSNSETVTLRNPWGNNGDGESEGPFAYAGETIDGVKDIGGGELEVPLSDLPKYFNGIEYGTD